MLPNSTLNKGRIPDKSDDDIVIIGFARSAMCRAKKGMFKDTALEQMLKPVLEAAINMAGIKKEQVEDIQIGNVLGPGASAAQARIAQYMAGFPHETTTVGINRLCSSGL